jgi:hypothetical protein
MTAWRILRAAACLLFMVTIVLAAAPETAAQQLAPAEPAPASEATAEATAPEPAAEPEPESPPPFAPVLVDPAIPPEELTLRLIPLTRDDLAALAAEWLGIVKAKTQEVVDEQVMVATTEGAAEDAPPSPKTMRRWLSRSTKMVCSMRTDPPPRSFQDVVSTVAE